MTTETIAMIEKVVREKAESNNSQKMYRESKHLIWIDEGQNKTRKPYIIHICEINNNGVVVSVEPRTDNIKTLNHEFIPYNTEYSLYNVQTSGSKADITLCFKLPKKTFVHNTTVENPCWIPLAYQEETDLMGCYYCRALNSVINEPFSICTACPLACKGKQETGYKDCCYLDLFYTTVQENWNRIKPLQKKKYTDGMIAADLTDEFPDFLDNSISVCSWFPPTWNDAERKRVETAYKLAAKARRRKYRKGSKVPRLAHLMETARIVLSLDDNPDVFIAALLHDVAEDASYTFRDIEMVFGYKVRELVIAETEYKMFDVPSADSWFVRKYWFLEGLHHAKREEKIITLSDKLSDMRTLAKDYEAVGEHLWERFNKKDARAQEWYYRSIAEALNEFNETDIWKEYDSLLLKVFGERMDISAKAWCDSSIREELSKFDKINFPFEC
ncbi:MAG: HD domain-containing protein [Lachnospiraceae bacterium]|nr:HD domain-containing protein [Lachnospiraceae bacterium]